jgi:hypothetical protein
MKATLQILLFALSAPSALSNPDNQFSDAELSRPSTLTCDDCKAETDVKWCQRCYAAPTHCTVPFSVSCNATVDDECTGALDGCIHYPPEMEE